HRDLRSVPTRRSSDLVRPPKMRGELHRFGDLTVIADCYNANPASVEAAVDLLVSLPRNGARVAVLGTMRELGAASEALHRRTARSEEHTSELQSRENL